MTMVGRLPFTSALAATLLCLGAPHPTAHADTYWDVPKDHAKEIAKRLRPGTIVVRYCPGCGGYFSVMRVKRARVAPGNDSKRHQVVAVREVLLAGKSSRDDRLVIGSKLYCGGSQKDWCPELPKTCPSDKENVDIPYSHYRDRQGTWRWVYHGLESPNQYNPDPLALSKQDQLRINRCTKTAKGRPSWWLRRGDRVFGHGTLERVLSKKVAPPGRLSLQAVNTHGFKRRPRRGQKVTIVPFYRKLPSFGMRVISSKRGTACTDEVWWQVKFRPVWRRALLAKFRQKAALPVLDLEAAVLFPPNKRAAFVPAQKITQLPPGFKARQLRGAVDLNGDGRADLFYLDLCAAGGGKPCPSEGSAIYLREGKTWKQVERSDPC
jgi:hypothetical protein